MKVVTIGGGTGQFTLLSAIKDFDIDVTAVVSMMDSGGSTGRLRDEYGVLPPGDILKCLIALSPYKDARHILQSRFQKFEKLRNHNAGNFLLVFLSQYLNGDFAAAVEALGEILESRGRVLPVTLDKGTLAAELETGDFIFGESEIDKVKEECRSKIKRTFLVPHNGGLEVYSPVDEIIRSADYIIVGPGDFYTSLTPNFLVNGMRDAIGASKAKFIYVLNIMTKFGETDNFRDIDFIEQIEKYMGIKMDIVIGNNQLPREDILERYTEEKSAPVLLNLPQVYKERKIYSHDLISDSALARHDIDKLAGALKEILI